MKKSIFLLLVVIFFTISLISIYVRPCKAFGRILIPGQTVFMLNAGGIEDLEFAVNQNSIVKGSFNTTENITFFIMTPAQFFSLGSNMLSYVYTTGKVRYGSISALLQPGTYYLVFDNRNIILRTNVIILQPIILQTFSGFR